MADTYCRGKYIFHLDSDVVLIKQLQKRDLFLFGRPVRGGDGRGGARGG
jgi:hypothetical protein